MTAAKNFVRQIQQFLLYFFVGLVLVAADQTAKSQAYAGNFGEFLNRFKPILGKQIFPNYNFAFSLPVPTMIIYIIYILLMIGLTVWFARQKQKTPKLLWSYVLIVAGALSNIYDRATLGYVRDFIFIFWRNIFNLADLYIITGILILLLLPDTPDKLPGAPNEWPGTKTEQ